MAEDTMASNGGFLQIQILHHRRWLQALHIDRSAGKIGRSDVDHYSLSHPSPSSAIRNFKLGGSGQDIRRCCSSTSTPSQELFSPLEREEQVEAMITMMSTVLVAVLASRA